MYLSRKNWSTIILLAVLGISAWLKFGLPQFFSVDLSVDRIQAGRIADDFLNRKGINHIRYLNTVVFMEDSAADRYLQRTIGFDKEEKFIKEYAYDLFYWAVRFFKPGRKEEFKVVVASKDGSVGAFRHFLEDTQAEPYIDKDRALGLCRDFLERHFNLKFKDYRFHEEQIKKYENRVDYNFSWEHSGVYIPWSKEENSGGAKLIVSAGTAGDRVAFFFRNTLDIPEKFSRAVERQLALGTYIGNIATFLLVLLIGWSIFIMVQRRNDLIMHLCKKWYIGLGILIFILGISGHLNNFNTILFNYDTSASLGTFLGNHFILLIYNTLFLSMTFMLPGLSGESLRQEVFPKRKDISFFHFINSTFLCRSISKMIILGYLLFFILAGLQALLFALGQRFAGVWVERVRLVELSSAYLPFLAALNVGVRASLSEEILFRLFGISLGKKYFKSAAVAIILTSIIWGFGHSDYAIFPVWFRGIEVGIMGLVLGYMFVRYGIIVTIVAHYVFDVFWGVAPYLVSGSNVYLFLSSLAVVLLPLFFALLAYLADKREEEWPLEWLLNRHQKFNLEVLLGFIKDNQDKLPQPQILRSQLIEHGWDVAVVDSAIKKAYR
ncbi:MAG: CPBP family intramembrane glutamic endopeptidase [Candidatus Omnitrophota bacterium]